MYIPLSQTSPTNPTKDLIDAACADAQTRALLYRCIETEGVLILSDEEREEIRRVTGSLHGTLYEKRDSLVDLTQDPQFQRLAGVVFEAALPEADRSIAYVLRAAAVQKEREQASGKPMSGAQAALMKGLFDGMIESLTEHSLAQKVLKTWGLFDIANYFGAVGVDEDEELVESTGEIWRNINTLVSDVFRRQAFFDVAAVIQKSLPPEKRGDILVQSADWIVPGLPNEPLVRELLNHRLQLAAQGQDDFEAAAEALIAEHAAKTPVSEIDEAEAARRVIDGQSRSETAEAEKNDSGSERDSDEDSFRTAPRSETTEVQNEGAFVKVKLLDEGSQHSSSSRGSEDNTSHSGRSELEEDDFELAEDGEGSQHSSSSRGSEDNTSHSGRSELEEDDFELAEDVEGPQHSGSKPDSDKRRLSTAGRDGTTEDFSSSQRSEDSTSHRDASEIEEDEPVVPPVQKRRPVRSAVVTPNQRAAALITHLDYVAPERLENFGGRAFATGYYGYAELSQDHFDTFRVVGWTVERIKWYQRPFQRFMKRKTYVVLEAGDRESTIPRQFAVAAELLLPSIDQPLEVDERVTILPIRRPGFFKDGGVVVRASEVPFVRGFTANEVRPSRGVPLATRVRLAVQRGDSDALVTEIATPPSGAVVLEMEDPTLRKYEDRFRVLVRDTALRREFILRGVALAALEPYLRNDEPLMATWMARHAMQRAAASLVEPQAPWDPSNTAHVRMERELWAALERNQQAADASRVIQGLLEDSPDIPVKPRVEASKAKTALIAARTAEGHAVVTQGGVKTAVAPSALLEQTKFTGVQVNAIEAGAVRIKRSPSGKAFLYNDAADDGLRSYSNAGKRAKFALQRLENFHEVHAPRSLAFEDANGGTEIYQTDEATIAVYYDWDRRNAPVRVRNLTIDSKLRRNNKDYVVVFAHDNTLQQANGEDMDEDVEARSGQYEAIDARYFVEEMQRNVRVQPVDQILGMGDPVRFSFCAGGACVERDVYFPQRPLDEVKTLQELLQILFGTSPVPTFTEIAGESVIEQVRNTWNDALAARTPSSCTQLPALIQEVLARGYDDGIQSLYKWIVGMPGAAATVDENIARTAATLRETGVPAAQAKRLAAELVRRSAPTGRERSAGRHFELIAELPLYRPGPNAPMPREEKPALGQGVAKGRIADRVVMDFGSRERPDIRAIPVAYFVEQYIVKNAPLPTFTEGETIRFAPINREMTVVSCKQSEARRQLERDI